MKGLATRTIVLILVGLLVLGIVGMLIYLGVGPFKGTTNFNVCQSRLMAYCTGSGVADWQDSGCNGATFKGHKPFCTGNCNKDLYDRGECGDADSYSDINCCNFM